MEISRKNRGRMKTSQLSKSSAPLFFSKSGDSTVLPSRRLLQIQRLRIDSYPEIEVGMGPQSSSQHLTCLKLR
jgi:hypothetical protein